MTARDSLEVERVANGAAVHPTDTCDARVLAELVHNGRVHHEREATVARVNALRHLHAQHGGMVQATLAGARVVNEPLVNGIDSARHGITAAAPANHGVYARQVDSVLAQEVLQHAHAVVKLVVYGPQLAQHAGIVEDVRVKLAHAVLEQRDLGGGGPRVDDEDSPRTSNGLANVAGHVVGLPSALCVQPRMIARRARASAYRPRTYSVSLSVITTSTGTSYFSTTVSLSTSVDSRQMPTEVPAKAARNES